MTTMNGTAASSSSPASQDSVSNTIKNVALEPKSVTGDQGSISNHSPKDLVIADRYLRSANAAKPANKKKVFRSLFQRLSPPSSRG
jgi:hypothetical protein